MELKRYHFVSHYGVEQSLLVFHQADSRLSRLDSWSALSEMGPGKVYLVGRTGISIIIQIFTDEVSLQCSFDFDNSWFVSMLDFF